MGDTYGCFVGHVLSNETATDRVSNMPSMYTNLFVTIHKRILGREVQERLLASSAKAY